MLKNILVLLAFLATSGMAAAAPIDGAKKFVNQFYGWYAKAGPNEGGFQIVLRQHPEYLHPKLLKELKDVLKCEANGDLCMDADPFLMSQDPCDKYHIASASTVAPNTYQFRMVGNCKQDFFVVVVSTPKGFKIQKVTQGLL